MAILNNSVVLPVEYGREIIRGVIGRSKALELGRRLPDMRGKTYKLNVASTLPIAGWVGLKQTGEPAAKPLSTLAWEGVDLVAEEIAVIIPVSINTLRDVENWVDVVPEITEQVVGAFQQVIDSTVFFGTNSPFPTGSLPSGGIVGGAGVNNTISWDGQGGLSFYNAINDAMAKVEANGYVPTAILGGPSLNSAFRSGITQLGILSTDQGQIGALPRHIDLTGGFDESTAFAIVGDFRYLVYAFREEMEMRLLSEATLTDGNTTYNLAQQDMIAFRFTMRLGVATPNPVNRVAGQNRYPFAVIEKSEQ